METPTILEGSEFASCFDQARIGNPKDESGFDVTVRVRRRTRFDTVQLSKAHGPERFDRASFARLFGAAQSDLDTAAEFARSHDIAVTGTNVGARSVTLHGTAAQFAAAFGTRLGLYATPQGEARGHEGGLALPAELAPVVRAVIGLDDQRCASSSLVRGQPASTPGSALLPGHLAAAYRFPDGFDGARQRIGVIGFADALPTSDLEAYCRSLGIAVPALHLLSARTDARASDRDTSTDRDGLSATLQLLAGLAPGAELAVYLALPTERGCIEALAAMVHAGDTALDVLCLGWAGAEESWSEQAARAIDDLLVDAAALGVTVCAASGDDGAGLAPGSNSASVSLPSSSPFALACGGTMPADTFTGLPWETVWNDSLPINDTRGGARGGASGGGISALFAMPPWQAPCSPPLSVRTERHGRGVPDVAAVAAPSPGVLCVLDGVPVACGGTVFSSAVWAALAARINQATGSALGFITPRLYALPRSDAFNDIFVGSNETTGLVGGYFARPGWDACTGLGTPQGDAVLTWLGYASDRGPGPCAPISSELSWTPLPGLVHDVSAASDGTLWALGIVTGDEPRPVYRSSPAGWLAMPDVRGQAVAVAPDGMPWVIDADGAICGWDGTVWQQHPGRASALAFAPDGTLWILARTAAGQDGAVQHWAGSEFVSAGISARHLRSALSGPPLLVTGAGEAFQFRGSQWCRLGTNVADVAADAAGRIWVASRTGGRIWCRNELDADWVAVSGAVAHRLVPLHHNGLLAIQRSGRLFVSRDPAHDRRAA